MGECKDNLTRTEAKPKKKKDKLFGKKKNKNIPVEDSADRFVNHIDICQDLMDHLVDVKAKDLKSEGSSEQPKNELKLNLLKSIKRDIKSIQERIDLYGDI